MTLRTPPWPPPVQDVRLMTYGTASGIALNLPELFTEPPCTTCGQTHGRRTAAPLVFRCEDGRDRTATAFIAQGAVDGGTGEREPGPAVGVYAEPLLAALTDVERAVLHWRPVEVRGPNRWPLFELLGSRDHVPAAAGAGLPGGPRPCHVCGIQPLPYYHPMQLQQLLGLPGPVQTPWGRPSHVLPGRAVAAEAPCFTWGEPDTVLSLVLPLTRGAALLGHRSVLGLGVLPLAIVDDVALAE